MQLVSNESGPQQQQSLIILKGTRDETFPTLVLLHTSSHPEEEFCVAIGAFEIYG